MIMTDNCEIISFIAEWYDPRPQIVKKFLIKYFIESHEVEIKEANGRKFLKKTKLPSNLGKDHFAVGNSVCIFARDMKLIEYGDSATRMKLNSSNEKTVIVASIDSCLLGKLFEYYENKGFTVVSIDFVIIEKESQIEKYKALLGVTFTREPGRINLIFSVRGPNSIQSCCEDHSNVYRLFGENVSCASSSQEASDFLLVTFC